ncbi:hypothetical protein WN943_029298 [Citrus x changshan-huyou]
MKGDSWRIAADNLVKGLKLRLKVGKLAGSCCNVIYLSASPNSRVKTKYTVNFMLPLMLLRSKSYESHAREAIRDCCSFSSQSRWRLVSVATAVLSPGNPISLKSSLMGFISAVEAWFVTVSPVDSISANLKGNPGLALAARLEKIAGGSTHSATVRRRPPTTCLTSEPAVYGRNEDKARILDMVLKNDPSDAANFRVIPLVGMGGIGKTTLAQEVYNDKLTDDFKPKAWVCVSDDFDILRISKAILESITRSSCGLTDLNSVQLKLKEAVFKKKFFISWMMFGARVMSCGKL